MCNMALLTERNSTSLRFYKHVAPTEQNNRQSTIGNQQSSYSYRNATNGSTRVARRAGR